MYQEQESRKKSVNLDCKICNTSYVGHNRSKYCEKCKNGNKKFHFTISSEDQIDFILKNKDKMLRKDIAKELKISIASLQRWSRLNKVSFTFYQKTYLYDEQTKVDVISYWLIHGVKKTKEAFPDIKVRSIIERYNDGKKFKKYPDYSFNDKLNIIRYQDFTGLHKILQTLGRTTKSTKCTIFSFKKRGKSANGMYFNGMSWWRVRHILLDPKVITTKKSKIQNARTNCKYVTWQEIEKTIKVDNQNMILLAQSMAKFQRWLHNNNIITEEKKICHLLKNQQIK